MKTCFNIFTLNKNWIYKRNNILYYDTMLQMIHCRNQHLHIIFVILFFCCSVCRDICIGFLIDAHRERNGSICSSNWIEKKKLVPWQAIYLWSFNWISICSRKFLSFPTMLNDKTDHNCFDFFLFQNDRLNSVTWKLHIRLCRILRNGHRVSWNVCSDNL